MTRLLFVVVVALLSALNVIAAGQKPNVVVILTDDQGWGDLSLHGNGNLSTPRIDRLASQGAQFDRFFVCPVCSPTRAEFLTGRYHARGGVYSTSAGGERLDLDERTIADVFRAAGYATGAFGKWHNGMQHPYHPNARGFDEYYGFCSGHWGNYFDPMLERNGEIVTGKGFLVDDLTDHAIDFIESQVQARRPFFAYVPYNTPHSPMQVPDKWWDRFKDKELAQRGTQPDKENIAHTRAALAMCENIDWNVGRLLDKLDALGAADNTIVVYFCDNGPNGARWNGGMKGRKGSTDEGGVRSPLFVRWPGKIAAGSVVKPIAGAIDLLPTLAALAEMLVTGTKPLDGIDISPWLLGTKEEMPNRMMFSDWRDRVSVRTQKFRMDFQGKLFDMHADPGQKRDVTKEFSDVAAELSKAVEHYQRNIGSELQKGRLRPFTIGGGAITQLPARDAVAHGNIKRSNRYPNCSYFSNWTATSDRLTFDVDVLEQDNYEVEIYYACPEKDIGATIELECNGARISAKVSEPHDPPATGAEHDRIPRAESYVKAFKPMSFGEIRLKKGRGTLTLKASDVPGAQAMEFRLMLLKRQGRSD